MLRAMESRAAAIEPMVPSATTTTTTPFVEVAAGSGSGKTAGGAPCKSDSDSDSDRTRRRQRQLRQLARDSLELVARLAASWACRGDVWDTTETEAACEADNNTTAETLWPSALVRVHARTPART